METPAAAPSNPLAVRLWRQLLSQVMVMMEASRLSFFRLLVAEKTKKALSSEKSKHVDYDEKQARCLHPAPKQVRRGNKWAMWTVCRLCGARTSYAPREGVVSKAAAKRASTQTASASTMIPTVNQDLNQPAPRNLTASPPVRHAQRSTVDAGMMSFLERSLATLTDQGAQTQLAVSRLASALEAIHNTQATAMMMSGYQNEQNAMMMQGYQVEPNPNQFEPDVSMTHADMLTQANVIADQVDYLTQAIPEDVDEWAQVNPNGEF